MALPHLIEIVPLTPPIRAEIAVPGSKSITNRALILAALATGQVTLRGALWSEDTQVMVEALRQLGFSIEVGPDPLESGNRTITVQGLGGKIPKGGAPDQPLELFVGNAGTAARFLAAFVTLGPGTYRLHGVPRMHQRPQAALFQALREMGYSVISEQEQDKLPVRISGRPVGTDAGLSSATGRSCSVSIERSSQFASALLLCAQTAGWNVRVVGENAEESPYVRMTTELIRGFPRTTGEFQIEPDASSGSYFLGADQLLSAGKQDVTVAHWPRSGWQMDEQFPLQLPRVMGTAAQGGAMRRISRLQDLGDSIMTAIVLAPLAADPVQFADLGRLRLQECERVMALRTELTRCGAKVIETGDTLEIRPSELHGATIETYDDHRMAMCFAILGLKVAGIKIQNPACVKKTFPNFFQKLAAAPPSGLGAVLRDGQTGKTLSGAELFAA